jgi:hypothetical protein
VIKLGFECVNVEWFSFFEVSSEDMTVEKSGCFNAGCRTDTTRGHLTKNSDCFGRGVLLSDRIWIGM